MKRISTLTLAVFLLIAAVASADTDGTWTASTRDAKEGRIHFNMARGNWNNFGNSFNRNAFTGLSEAQINAATQTPVQFQLKREAGTISFDGFFRNGKGAGEFTFAPNAAYLNTIRNMGIEVDLERHNRRGRGSDDDDALFTLAALDVSTDFIRSIQAEGYKLSLEKYQEMRIFNVTPEYIREMRSLGFKDISASKLVETRIHGATPDYIRKMRASGWDLTLNKYIENRIHGVTPKFAEEMRKAGYGDLSRDDLVAFRIHGVTPEFIDEMAKLGYKNIDSDDLVAMKIHGVNPTFVRELQAAGYHNVPIDKLVAMKIHGVDAKFIKKMNDVD